MQLKDKVVVVTGSTRGIGRAIAEACAREGASVVVCSRKAEAVDAAVNEMQKAGHRVSGIFCDVSSQADLERLLAHATTTWGRVHVWINNAGLSGGLRFLEEMGPEEIAEIVRVNVTGTMLACRLAIPYLLGQGGGVLINMSGKGWRGEASPHTAVYAAT